MNTKHHYYEKDPSLHNRAFRITALLQKMVQPIYIGKSVCLTLPLLQK